MIQDLKGQKFGYLTALYYAGRKASGKQFKTQWAFRCDCGKIVVMNAGEVKNGRTISCGCKKSSNGHYLGIRNKTHGKVNTRLYCIFDKMKQRCLNPHHTAYKNYGGRGITICEEWRHNFQAFYDWAMANGYRDDLTIDRINNDGNYEPSNCRWATAKEQANNRRNTKHKEVVANV